MPIARRGAIQYTVPSTAWNTEAVFRDQFIPFMKQLNCNVWEFAGSYPIVGPNNLSGSAPGAGWIALGSYVKTYGFRITGTHDGPNPTSAANLGTALTKLNGWNCNQIGQGSGYPSGAINLPGAGTAITQASAISAWQASAATMNSWGQSFQTNSGAGVLGTPFGVGVFAGTALTAGRSCARFYRHFHSEQGKWIQNTGTKYDGHYISELIYTTTDPTVAFAESDQCWLLDGLWMSGGSAPSVGLQGPGDPNPGQGKNRLVHPDLMERWQDKIPQFHIKDLGPNDQGTQVANVGDNNGAGNATPNPAGQWIAPSYGGLPWDPTGAQDTVPFQETFKRFRHPEQHEWLLERDGLSGTATSNAWWKKVYVQAYDMFDKIVLDRSPGTIRMPYVIPQSDADWAASANLPIGARPPIGNGAPGPECPPELNGENRVGYKARVEFKGTWARFSNRADSFSYLWLRDGAPLPVYQSADLGTKSGCTPTSNSNIYYVIQPEDAGHTISCQVTIVNDQDSASTVVTESVTVPGHLGDAKVEADLTALGVTVAGMGLTAGVTSELQNTIAALRSSVIKGQSPCVGLEDLKTKIGTLVPRKITTGQQSTLVSAINAIETEYGC